MTATRFDDYEWSLPTVRKTPVHAEKSLPIDTALPMWWVIGGTAATVVLAVVTWSVNKNALPAFQVASPQPTAASPLPSALPTPSAQLIPNQRSLPEGSYIAVYMTRDDNVIDVEAQARAGMWARMWVNADGTGYVDAMGDREDFTFDETRMYTGTGEDDISDYAWDGQRLIVSEPRATVEFVPIESPEGQRLLNINRDDVDETAEPEMVLDNENNAVDSTDKFNLD